jgi:hypothetical protein
MVIAFGHWVADNYNLLIYLMFEYFYPRPKKLGAMHKKVLDNA